MAFSKSTDEFHHVKFYRLQARQIKSIEKGTGDEKQHGWSAGRPQGPDSFSCLIPWKLLQHQVKAVLSQMQRWEQSLPVFMHDPSPCQPQSTLNTFVH